MHTHTHTHTHRAQTRACMCKQIHMLRNSLLASKFWFCRAKIKQRTCYLEWSDHWHHLFPSAIAPQSEDCPWHRPHGIWKHPFSFLGAQGNPVLLILGQAKTVPQGTVQGGRRRGRHRKWWEDNIREWTGLEWNILLQKAENCKKWRKLV